MKLRVLTYNIHRAIGVDRRFRLDRICQILAHYDADIVLLQEVDEGAPRSRGMNLAAEIAARLDYPNYALGSNHRMRRGSYGNATLSRLPLLSERNIDLTIEGRKQRGCQFTTLELRGNGEPRTLDVFNLHLGLLARERERQIGILVHCGEFPGLDGDRPCLVAGDFNDWRSRIRPIFTEVFRFGSATDLRSRWNSAMSTYPSFSPRAPLDRIYYRGLVLEGARRCRLPISRVASDHLPVIADFETS